MSPRMNVLAASSKSNLMQMLIEFGTKVANSGLEKSLVELVKIRASQLNGCARCLHMHTRDARRLGETEERLYMIAAWQESSLFTPRERAALAWTEALTLLASTRAPDEIYAEVKAHFTDEDSLKLTMMINVINDFNRISVGYCVPEQD